MSLVEKNVYFSLLAPIPLLWHSAQELEVLSFNHPYSLKTKSSQCQCHYVVMARSETNFQAPLNLGNKTKSFSASVAGA